MHKNKGEALSGVPLGRRSFVAGAAALPCAPPTTGCSAPAAMTSTS